MPAIGQLSTGDPPNVRQQTDDSIASTEKALNGITRKLNDQEAEDSRPDSRVPEAGSRCAHAGDVDGALNLAIKAKALLDELHP